MSGQISREKRNAFIHLTYTRKVCGLSDLSICGLYVRGVSWMSVFAHLKVACVFTWLFAGRISKNV
jgi:hypothetical protein